MVCDGFEAGWLAVGFAMEGILAVSIEIEIKNKQKAAD